MTKVTAVIMCGGSGTRLWPASRPSRPKQFIPLMGVETLFEQTIDRVGAISGLHRIVVIAGSQHAALIATQLGDAKVPVSVLLEPEGRDSAPAIAAATAFVESNGDDDVMVVVASDHYIPDPKAFCADIDTAVESAVEGGIVTLGIAPAEASSAYGYIQPDFSTGAVGPVAAFFEKPDRETAADYIRNGYLWNSGNFIAGVKTLAQAFEQTAGDVLVAARTGVRTARDSGRGHVLGEAFSNAPKVSFDYAVMEKYGDLKVVRSAVAWSDLGAWDAVHHALLRDRDNNSTMGDAVLVGAHNCHVRVSDGRMVVLSDVNGLNVVAEDDVVLVSRLDRAQNVKKVVNRLKEDGRAVVDTPDTALDLAGLARQWRLWLETAVLPLWWANGYDRDQGLWRESLDLHTARPTGADARARVQGRQAYVYAAAGAAGWAGPWEAALQAGLDGAARHYCGDDGLLRTLVSADGAVLSDAVLLYDQTFIMLALSQGRDVVEDAEKQALQVLDAVERRFRRDDRGAGFREAGDHPFQSNAHMHLFEAALAWSDAGGDQRWHDLAQEIAQLAAERMIDAKSGAIREFYTPDWKPVDGADGRIQEPGHQFEWAWLFKRYANATGETSFSDVASGLFKAGMRGVDRKRKVAVLQTDDSDTPLSDVARLWSQTEWLKAAVVLSADKSDPKAPFYRSQISTAAQAVDRYLQTDIRGLWADKMLADGSFVEEPVPASTLYHIVGAIEALEAHVKA